MSDQAVILVGGRGTRLGALTNDVPKPLLTIDGRPFLDFLIARVGSQGFSHILLLAGHLGTHVARFADERRKRGVDVDCIVEAKPLGTAGALFGAIDRLQEEFLLLNGDSLFAIDYRALREGLGDGDLAMALRSIADAGRYGVATLRDGIVERFAPRPSGGAGGGIINGGVYWVRRAPFEGRVPRACSLETEILPDLAAKGRLRGQVFDGFFIDIGVPADLARARTLIPGLTADGAAVGRVP